MTGRVSRFKEAFETVWSNNIVPDVYEFKMQEGACFDRNSDVDGSVDYSSGFFSYSFDDENTSGVYCNA